MEEYLYLFHSTLGVVRMRKALQAAGMTFRVADIPRALRGGCGLAIWLTCEPGDARRWIFPGQTEAVYLCRGEEYRLISRFAPAPSP